MFDLHRETSCWLVERLANGKHAKQMMFSRFLKFVNNLLENRRSMVRSLGKKVCKDIRSLTGRNLHMMKEETKLNIQVGTTSHIELSPWMVYDPPAGEEWRLPLLVSLLSVRDLGWEILFNDDEEGLENNVIQLFLDSVCIRR